MKPLVFVLALGVSACSGGTPCPEPFYDGKGTDEAWRTMKDGEARATTNDAKAVTMFFPAAGEKISNATAPTFKWTTPLSASNLRLAPRPASMLSRVSELLYSTAWAHLPPVTGPVHLLRMTVPGRACPIELLTTRVEWIPGGEAWTQLKDTAGKAITLDVFSAYMQETRITEGPFHLTTPLTFSVAP